MVAGVRQDFSNDGHSVAAFADREGIGNYNIRFMETGAAYCIMSLDSRISFSRIAAFYMETIALGRSQARGIVIILYSIGAGFTCHGHFPNHKKIDIMK